MNQKEIIDKLWKLAKPNPEKCLNCGYENSCQMRGCAIIRAAIIEIENLSTQNQVLKEAASCSAD